MYMQGVAEALDAFDVAELLAADQTPSRQGENVLTGGRAARVRREGGLARIIGG